MSASARRLLMAAKPPVNPAAAYLAAALADSPLGLWMMDEGSGTSMFNASGDTDPDLTGGYTGGVDLTETDSALGAHARFDGTNDWASIAGASDIYNGGRTRTIEFLMKVNTWTEELVIEAGSNYGLASTFAAYTTAAGELVIALCQRISTNSFFLLQTYDLSSRTDEFFVSFTLDRTNMAPAIDLRIDGAPMSPDSTLDTLTGKTIGEFSNFPTYIASRAGTSLFNAIEMSGLGVYSGILSTARRDAHYAATGLS